MSYYRKKTILITGAASGIGKRFAEKIIAYEPDGLILWDRNTEVLTRMKEELSKDTYVQISGVDITEPGLVQIEAAHLIKQGLLPDIILNCAGIVTGKYFHRHSYTEIDQTLEINVAGSMWVARAFLNEMMDRGSGHIVNMASASGYIGNPKMSVYAASKWAVLGWTESLQLEMERLNTGVYVTAIIPGYIDTGMFQGVKAPRLVPLLQTDDMVTRMIDGISMRKKSVKAPFMVHFVPVLKSLLPSALFDWLAGSVMGVYTSMDSFEGRVSKKA